MSTNVNKEIRELKSSVLRLSDLVSKQGNKAADDVEDTINAQLKSIAKNSGENIRKLFDDTKKTIESNAKEYKNKISENPIKSTAIALGVGAILGAIYGRR